MSEVDQPDDAGRHTDEAMRRLEQAMEKYAPTGYDPASDDLTIPFAMELVEKDRKIESDAKVIAALREKLKLMDDYYQTGGDLMSHMAHMAQDALAIIEQTAGE